MDEHKTKLRPIVYTTNNRKSGAQNTTQQMLLLKALQITQDPEKLRDMIHARTVAEVFITLDKLQMRKEYHSALDKAGISFDYIVNGIKSIADNGSKDSDKLKAFQTLLKSVGMEDYKENTAAISGTWEELLLQKIEEEKKGGVSKRLLPPIQYEVKQPVIPESAKKKQDEEDEMTSGIYDNK